MERFPKKVKYLLHTQSNSYRLPWQVATTLDGPQSARALPLTLITASNSSTHSGQISQEASAFYRRVNWPLAARFIPKKKSGEQEESDDKVLTTHTSQY